MLLQHLNITIGMNLPPKDLFESNEEWVQEIAEYVYDNVDGLVINVNGTYGIPDVAYDYDTDEPENRRLS